MLGQTNLFCTYRLVSAPFSQVERDGAMSPVVRQGSWKCFAVVFLKMLSAFVKSLQLYFQRKPEEESPRKDDAKKAKQEPEVNGGSGDAVPSGNEVSENMEEEEVGI